MATHLLWGVKLLDIFLKTVQFVCFCVYFEINLNKKLLFAYRNNDIAAH